MTSLGGTVGASVAFGISANKTTATGVSDAVYIVFIVIMCFAIVLAALCIKHPEKITRDDGTHLAEFRSTNATKELRNLFKILTERKIVVLTPAFLASEMCLSIVSSLNSYYFNLRTRSLNDVLFQAIMIAGSISLSVLLDAKSLSRRRRGLIACSLVGSITTGACAGLIGWMSKYGLEGRLNTPPPLRLIGRMLDSAGWVVASLSNDPVKVAFYSGFTKGTASSGFCICFVMDSQGVTYMRQAIAMFVLYGLGSLSLIYAVVYYMKDTDCFLEEDVVVPIHLQREKSLVIEANGAPADTTEGVRNVDKKLH